MTDNEMENLSILDLDSPDFNADLYLQEVLKTSSLRKVMDLETEITRDIATLRSDTQTLVYENYNKFISATETVRKMKMDFKQMETDLDLLNHNMNSITTHFDSISDTLKDSRSQISRLSSVHNLLSSLEFLFKLPNRLNELLAEGSFKEATKDYLQAQNVLEEFGHLQSFSSIKEDTEKCLTELKTRLRERISQNQGNSYKLKETVGLLLNLNEPAKDLCMELIKSCMSNLKIELDALNNSKDHDLIEFVDLAASGFLAQLVLFVQAYNETFCQGEIIEEVAEDELNKFVTDIMTQYFNVTETVLERDHLNTDTILLVRALDRFYRKLQSVNNLIRGCNFMRTGGEVIIRSGRRQCKYHLQSLKNYFSEHLTGVRQSLALWGGKGNEESFSLPDLVRGITLEIPEKLKGALKDLLVFLQGDLSFGINPQFQEAFCVDSIRESLVVGFLHHLNASCRGFSENQTAPANLLLILSKVCLEFEQTIVKDLLWQTDDWFNIAEKPGSEVLTTKEELTTEFKETAKKLINSFVRTQGLIISQMLRKSVETRDWLNTIEPRTVRAVMKRVVEDISVIDGQIGQLYEETGDKEGSSDSSRKTQNYSVSQFSKHQAYRSNWSSFTGHLIPNIHKLFSERIEIFSSVEFSRASILTGIIKISLKTLLECVRLRTLSKYGLQQIQVDIHYLQLYLWRFVSDENLVYFLLDEILGSAVQRCLDPVLMDWSIVEIICEKI